MRLLHRIYAAIFGYFWLPCPKCGASFGGHEIRDGNAHVIVEDHEGVHMQLVCPDCDTAQLRADNQVQFAQAFGQMVRGFGQSTLK